MKLRIRYPVAPPSPLQGELNYFHISDEETERQGNELSNLSKVTQAITDGPRARAPACPAVPSLGNPLPPLVRSLSLLSHQWVETAAMEG